MSCSIPCIASTCDRCSEMDCIWSQHYRRVLNVAGRFNVYIRDTSKYIAEPMKMSCSIPCITSTCDRCSEMDCIWSQNYRRVLNVAGSIE